MSASYGRGQGPQRSYGCLVVPVVVIVVLIGSILLIAYLRSRHQDTTQPTTPPTADSNTSTGNTTGLPELPNKPQPKNVSFMGCPPEGDGGDPALNRLKNRIDDAPQYFPVDFDAVEQLPWPKSTERTHRSKWPPADAAEVARYEGLPLSVEGYLAGSREEGPESCNCHGADDVFRDFHIWLTKTPEEDRSGSIVIEMTPPVKSKHPNWTTTALGKIARANQRVRVSGWLMFDPEHPDQVGKTRGTIWEIHPIMQFEVEQNGRWIPLDNYGSARTARRGKDA